MIEEELENLKKESVKDIILEELESFLRKNRLNLLDKKDEISFLIRETIDGKARTSLEKLVKADIRNNKLKDVAKDVYDFVIEELQNKGQKITEDKKLNLFFTLKTAVKKATLYQK